MFTSLTIAALVATASTVSATRLYVSSYTGNITTLNLTQTADTYKLIQLEATNGCAPNASWLQIDVKKRNLFCLDEGMIGPNGSLTSFKINNDTTGSLKLVKHASIPAAPVNSAIYTGPNGTQLMAVAHYTTALTTYKLDSTTATFTPFETFNFTMPKPGPLAERQAKPHPHQVVIDPTNKYMVVPDLGADLLRVFYIDPQTLRLSERSSIAVKPGSGPRHGVFHLGRRIGNQKGEMSYYLLNEIGSTVVGFKVAYRPDNGGLVLTQFQETRAYGNATGSVASGNAPAEIAIAQVKGRGSQLIVSNRNATFFTSVKNPDPANSTTIVSDSMATFSLPADKNGSFEFSQLTPAGGLYPRHFRLNRRGNLMAVGLQLSGWVAVYRRCTDTGRIDQDPVACFGGLGGVSSLVWDEPDILAGYL
ncbi:MAG: hypothetical protein Q9182_006472 [Xanthomendoza sp. 2 TL-2023]